MLPYAKTTPAIGYDRDEHHALVQALVDRIGAAESVPTELLIDLTGDEIRILTNGLEWALAGEAISDDFLRHLARCTAATLRADARLSTADVQNIRDNGVCAASLRIVVIASTSPNDFVELLSAADDAPYWEHRRRELFEGPATALSDATVHDAQAPVETLTNQPSLDLVNSYEVAVQHALRMTLRTYRITAAISRRDEQGHQARKALTANVATHLFGRATNLSSEIRRGFGPLIVKSLRELFTTWLDDMGSSKSDVIEPVNDHSTFFPPMTNRDEWRVIARRCLTLQTTDPVRSHAIALREYAGFSTRDIGTILGITLEEVATYLQVDANGIVSPAQ